MVGAYAVVVCALVAQSSWSFSAGPERFSLRDISRQGPPADASPVAWEGSGPSLAAVYTREGRQRLHRLNVDVAKASSFVYEGPMLRRAAPGADHAARIEGRYEYRRYVLNDLVARGLDVGIGVQGIGRRLSFTRDTTAGDHRQSDTAAAIAATAVVRWRRSARWSADVTWVNGGALLHQHEMNEGASSFERSRWGTGWLTDLAVQGSVRLTEPWSLSVAYLRTGEGAAVVHDSYAFGRRRILAGVTYAR